MRPTVMLDDLYAVEPVQPEGLEDLLAAHLACVDESLEAVEGALRSTVDAAPLIVRTVASHLVLAGGKRLRPALVLLWARAAGRRPSQVIQRAVCCEVAHLASLLHDDVIDSADRRRGRDSCNSRWGNKASVLVADWLLGGAFHDLVTSSDTEALGVLSDATRRMCDAELRQSFRVRDLSLDERDCLSIAEGKTGSLMAACCRLGVLGGADSDLADAATRFGAAVGTAFQIADDILDLSGDEEQLGKPVAQDLADGRMTLPILYALREAPSDEAVALKALFTAEQPATDEQLSGPSIVMASGALDLARRTAAEIIAEAMSALAALPDSPAKTALAFVADYVVARSH